jgi:hypothetical protein
MPFDSRIILLPQCLRNLEHCQAKEKGNQYLCARCGQCKIDGIHQLAEELGYRGVFVLKGGRAVSQILNLVKPGAVIGVACHYEGAMGLTECEQHDVPAQFVPLLRDGCVDTDVDLEEVEEIMKFQELPAYLEA